MIHAQDLRIGNWVKDNGEYFQVQIIASDKIDCEPIPLTPETILKCDFAKCYESTWLITFEKLNNGLFEIQFLKKYKAMALFKGEKLRDIEYLHQLQNLFFAIYSEELSIQL